MFLEIKKNPQIVMQHKDMDIQYVAPVTSNFRINLDFIAELSTYTIKEVKHKKLLDGQSYDVPVGTRVIHFEMSYTHSTHKKQMGTPNEHSVNERYFFKLAFLPEALDEYTRIRALIDSQTLS